jgi:TonB family protein
VVASANGVLPLLNIKADVPALKAKQSSLVPNQLMKSVAPLYPEAARRLGLAGPVTVEAHIGSDGNVKSVDVLEGEPVLARAASVAVKQWKYRPSYLNGEPVASTAKVTLNFKPPPSQQ